MIHIVATQCSVEHEIRSMNPLPLWRVIIRCGWHLSVAVLVVGPVVADEPIDRVDFISEIRPILSDRCFLCHGPDAENREAELRLDIQEGAYQPSEYGAGSHIIKPGDPDQSEAYLRIISEDDGERMPPEETKLSLTPREIELFRRWIEQGAEFESHWSFRPLTDVPIPDVGDSTWVRGEIDRFILRRLAREQLTPNPEAPREKLIRRLSFDLTGLPPTLSEIDTYLADDAPDAYERLVDRLLSSDHYGERMAADWLDVARYSDTYGYQVDRDRFVWPWRDWVVRSFNRNQPYDQFITEQLAGDLLPDATDDQILATTFNRLHPQKVEGGSVPEEFRIEYVTDRTQTFATAFLGLTMECARCHEHKYDPITQEEYYQFCAFFDNVDEAGLYSYFTESIPTPTMLLTDDDTKRKMAAIEERIAAAKRKLADFAKSREPEFLDWLARESLADELAAFAKELPGEVLHLDFEEPSGPNPAVPGVLGSAVKLTGDDAIKTQVGNFTRNQPFSVSLWINTPDVKDRAVIFHRSRAWTDAASRGYELLIEEGRLSAALIHFWPGNAIRVRTQQLIPTNSWWHVVVTYDGSSRAKGLRIHVNGELADCDIVRDNLFKNITGGGGEHIAIGERFRDRGFTQGLIDEFRVFDRELTELEIAHLHDQISLSNVLDRLQASETADERAATESATGEEQTLARLRELYLSAVDESYQAQVAALQQVRDERSTLVDTLSEIMVMREMETPKQTFFLNRGVYDARGDAVNPETPLSLPPFPEDQPRNRLGLARWLTSPLHPLTPRVVVNRFWQMMFGTGLVRTQEDFGSQGELPTHPELLDWLAGDFVTHGWDVKRLLKQMAMSATYRQSTKATPDHLKSDPTNRLLGRAPSYRLPAEMLRDNALSVSGLLVQRIGGPPAKPYEVEASFKPAKRDTGEGLYRRSLYTYWKRTGPAPVMMTLDASKRDVCRVRREQTSSPLQAFVMLNGPQFVEASRALAQRVIRQHPGDVAAVLHELFRTLTSRSPNELELSILHELYQAEHSAFMQHPQRAIEYLSVGESPRDESLDPTHLASLSAVANTLFNFDECVMKR